MSDHIEIDLPRLRELAEAATQGSWLWKHDELLVADDDPESGYTYQGTRTFITCADVDPLWPSKEDAAKSEDQCEANCEFIAAADPETVLALLDKLQWYKDSFLRGFDNLMAVNKARTERDELKAENERLAARVADLCTRIADLEGGAWL